mmetsp:Transcript_37895/g.77327  ORF Transcript_37895/g.77327 Transcript_37895/m.77327 type:complete len:288 (+) Transcript_37895:730-1593(+)
MIGVRNMKSVVGAEANENCDTNSLHWAEFNGKDSKDQAHQAHSKEDNRHHDNEAEGYIPSEDEDDDKAHTIGDGPGGDGGGQDGFLAVRVLEGIALEDGQAGPCGCSLIEILHKLFPCPQCVGPGSAIVRPHWYLCQHSDADKEHFTPNARPSRTDLPLVPLAEVSRVLKEEGKVPRKGILGYRKREAILLRLLLKYRNPGFAVRPDVETGFAERGPVGVEHPCLDLHLRGVEVAVEVHVTVGCRLFQPTAHGASVNCDACGAVLVAIGILVPEPRKALLPRLDAPN